MRFLRTALSDLDRELQDRGSLLVVRRGDAARELNRLTEETGAWAVYFNRDFTPYARQRDTRTTRGLQLTGVVTQVFDDLLLLPPVAVMDADAEVPPTFAAFSRRWFDALDVDPQPYDAPAGARFRPADELPAAIDAWAESLAPGLETPSSWPGATPAAAQERLRRFAADSLAGYDRSRDLPGQEDGTSRLSAALKLGFLDCCDAAAHLRQRRRWSHGRGPAARRAVCPASSPGATTQRTCCTPINLLRHHTLREPAAIVARPLGRCSAGAPPALGRRPHRVAAGGRGDAPAPPRGLDARPRPTGGGVGAGAPDEGFLTDWRLGEEHFIRYLVDLDLASNDMGWQRAAGVGVNTASSPSTFNPQRQGEKFDPDGAYVRRWVPELADMPPFPMRCTVTRAMSAAMQARAKCRIGIDYPEPVVPPAMPRARAG